MGNGNLTIQVRNLSPKVNLSDLIFFFSYCGTVHSAQIVRDKNQSPYALITFVQPYAFQTALLLDDAMFGGQPICVIPAYVIRIPIDSDEDNGRTQMRSRGNNIAAEAVRRTMTSRASKGSLDLMLKTGRDELEEDLKVVPEKGSVVVEQTKSAIDAVEQAAGRIGSVMKNNASHGATRFSHVLDKASRSASHFGVKK